MEDQQQGHLVGSPEDLRTRSPETVKLDEASREFVGQWNELVSTTNWEKGRIIHEWRTALVESETSATEYSDEAWARRVGGVTGQHVGRLRRVFERFGHVHTKFAGLYWSHFHASLDWDDAELWLEGAVQSGWSVSQMRRQRWEAMGAVPAEEPKDKEIVVADRDEDVDPGVERDETVARRTHERGDTEAGPLPEGPDFGDEPQGTAATAEDGATIYSGDSPSETVEFVRPFENLTELPEDLAEAFEHFKLAILRHKADDWNQIPRDEVLAALDALKELALAPAMN
jgi:hypothetical protein